MRKLGRKLTSALLALAMFVSLLPIGAAPAQAADTTHDISRGTLTISENGNYTVTGTTTTNQIVVKENVTATVTLNGVNITGAAGNSATGAPAQSPIDLAAGATLTLILAENSTNTLTGGAGTGYCGAPGIHVPDDAALIIQGGGSLTVTGGSYKPGYGAPGIGGTTDNSGAESGSYTGEDCGTVIILSSGNLNVKGGTGESTATDIGGGSGTQKGDDGQGIHPSTDGNYTVYGDLELPCDITIPQGATVVIPEGASLEVPEGSTLTNNGTIQKDGGSFINDGTVTGQQPADDRYTINFAEETITIGKGYEVYTAETEGDKIQSGGSITAHIGESLYIQKTGSETTGRTAISIPARPEAPNSNLISIDYDGEAINFNSGLDSDTLEHATEQTNPEWKDVPSGAALSDMGWTGNQMYLYFRIKATETSFASEATTTGVQIPSRLTAPIVAGTVTGSTENSITIGAQSGQEYRCGIGDAWGEWKTISSDSNSITFENLSPGTEYTIQNRYKSDRDDTTGQEQFVSFANSTTATTWPRITATSLKTGYVGVPYSAQLEAVVAEGTTVSWSLENSSLPAGLTLSSDGTISGTPTTATPQMATFTVTATIGEGASSTSNRKALSIIILAGTSDISITSGSGTYTYGDTITISGSIAASTTPPASNGINAITEPAQNQVGLYLDDTQLATANVGDDGAFTLTYDTSDKGITLGETAQPLTVRYGGSSNLNSGEATVQITLNPKSIEAKFNGPLTKVYDGTIAAPKYLKLKLYDVLTGDDVSVTWRSITFDTAEVGNNRLITATGISLSGSDANYYVLSDTEVTTSGSITGLEQDALTISGLPDKVYVGDQFTLTASGGSGTGALSWEVVSGSAEIDEKTGAVRVTGEGTIVIRATKAKDATHSATSAETTFTANEIPYTGMYSHEISTSVGDHGTISVDRYATEGDEVTITVSPDDAYKLDDLSVTANGKEVEVTANDDGTFSFTMPSGDVKISATFAEDPDWTEPEEPATYVSDLFIDVAANAWYKDAVQYAYDNGLMTGVSDTEFAPEATTTRAMIVSILARLEGIESAQAAGFADVDDEWYATAVNWAANVGVAGGYEDGTFKPNDAITREQLAAILMNYAACIGQDVSNRADLTSYTDQPSTWAEETMQWAVAEGLISGVTADTLQPQGSATRAQVAAILQRFLCK